MLDKLGPIEENAIIVGIATGQLSLLAANLRITSVDCHQLSVAISAVPSGGCAGKTAPTRRVFGRL